MESLGNLKDIATIFGTAVAAIVAFLAFQQYKIAVFNAKEAQKWKEIEFCARQIDDFFKDEVVQKALLVLDWRVVKIPIRVLGLDKQHKVDRKVLRDSLMTNRYRERKGEPRHADFFSYEEKEIRMIFDHFFTRLGAFGIHARTGAISRANSYAYLEYWIDLLNGDRPDLLDSETIEVIREFLVAFEYSTALDVLSWKEIADVKRRVRTPWYRRA